jgi:hypothetical protein
MDYLDLLCFALCLAGLALALLGLLALRHQCRTLPTGR